ncbi:ABC transporter ATP-binding protein [Actinomadura flavalba]|uniref:ABC transporter ATP-binding protein n=1 Tax=Actinomadura flavalba TaxID=1120938 RepID=UPI00036C7915|nr:ABC transporter ATP-binding protein [Actinomadura flavalba]
MRAADRLVARTVRHGGPWSAVLAAGVVGGAVVQLLLPYALGRALDVLVAGAAGASFWLTACAVLVAGVIVCETLGVWAGGASGARASARLRRGIVRHVLDAGPGLTRRFGDGDLVARAGMNAEEVGRAPDAIVTAAALLIPTVGGLVALALIDPWLPLALAAGLVLILLVLRGFLRETTQFAGDYQRVQGDIASRLTDALAGIRTIAAARTVPLEARRVLAPLPELRLHGMSLWRANARAGVRAGLVVPLLELVVLGVGGWRLAAGEMSVGELYAAARYVVLGAGLSAALGQVGQIARARSAAGRVSELLAVPAPRAGTRALPPGSGTLEFRDVAAPGLSGVSCTIPGGSVTAVVGRSGSGKSLLAALAGRLVDPERGTVLLDGVPLHTLDRADLRRAVGYAFERPVLIGRTLTDAVALGVPHGAGDGAAVREAARLACVDGFVRRLPDGYATVLEDAPMSGGERQRLGLARAVAQGERLLVLDDATSSLDTVTEQQVGKALTTDLRGRTRLITAHRLTTAARADLVLWLDDGRLRAAAPHADLWRDPDYRAVFRAEEAS